MLGLYFFVVLILMFAHWGLVMPTKQYSTKNANAEFYALFGTIACLFPPVYILVMSLIYVYKKGKEKNEKNNSRIK